MRKMNKVGHFSVSCKTSVFPAHLEPCKVQMCRLGVTVSKDHGRCRCRYSGHGVHSDELAGMTRSIVRECSHSPSNQATTVAGSPFCIAKSSCQTCTDHRIRSTDVRTWKPRIKQHKTSTQWGLLSTVPSPELEASAEVGSGHQTHFKFF